MAYILPQPLDLFWQFAVKSLNVLHKRPPPAWIFQGFFWRNEKKSSSFQGLYLSGDKTNLNLSRICPVQTGKTLTNLNLSRTANSERGSRFGIFRVETKGHSVQDYPSSWPPSINSRSLARCSTVALHGPLHFARRYQTDLSPGLTIVCVYLPSSSGSSPNWKDAGHCVAKNLDGPYRFRRYGQQCSMAWDGWWDVHGTAINAPQ